MTELIQEIKEVKKWGNSGGISVPKELIGQLIKITIESRTNKIKEEILEILSPYLEDIIGIYLTGSYARNEQEEESDIDVIAISNTTSKSIKSGKYNIEINKLEEIRGALKNSPIRILPRLKEAKAIMNKYLLDNLNNIEITKDSFNSFFKENKNMYTINKNEIEIDELKKEKFLHKTSIYSLILRLRAIYFYKMLTTGKSFSKKEFKQWLINNSKLKKEDIDNILNVYNKLKEDKNPDKKIPISMGKNLLEILKREINIYYGKKKKAS
ncbi:MAG: DUF2080 family transposase-associated protein [Nanoarchaeota archaeon]